MNRSFLNELTRSTPNLEGVKNRLTQAAEAVCRAEKTAIERDYRDAEMIMLALREPVGSTARRIAEAFLDDVREASDR